MAKIEGFLHVLLENPLVFEVQQRLCNNYSAIREEFAELLGRPGQSIIDIGCSTGTCAGEIIDFQRIDYTGVDIEENYIAVASKRFPQGRFLAMDARSTPFNENSFDIAMFIGVMHHMDDALVRDCLKEVRRIAKPSARVLVAEPVFTNGEWLSTVLLKMDRGKNIRDEAGYRSLFAGFEVERQRYFRFSAHRFCSYVLRPH